MNTAINTLAAVSDNYRAAYGRIKDVDVGFEAANLAREQIRQQASVAILAQANLQPGLALQLLEV